MAWVGCASMSFDHVGCLQTRGVHERNCVFKRFQLLCVRRRARDDAAVIVLDLLPHRHTSFPKQVRS